MKEKSKDSKSFVTSWQLTIVHALALHSQVLKPETIPLITVISWHNVSKCQSGDKGE